MAAAAAAAAAVVVSVAAAAVLRMERATFFGRSFDDPVVVPGGQRHELES